ncbi:MAG: terminase [Pseudomonadota bacterium]
MPADGARSLSAEDYELQLIDDIGSFTRDPLGFVWFAFPWGEAGTALEKHDGPLEWQIEILVDLRDGLVTVEEALQLAVASGHGIGKSALVAMIVCWAIATCSHSRGVITAGTENQLRTKTQPEVAKWARMMICAHWFECTATKIYAKSNPESWRFDFIPWSETNPEAFAGLHNQGRRILVVIDEASQVADIIFETIQGALTDEDTEILWLVFGNPTRNTGRFRECFGRERNRWICRQIDSRTVSITNKRQIQIWVEDYGEDSDFVRVRVRGVFPRVGSNQLISSEAVSNAQGRYDPHAPRSGSVIIGVDVARFGDDQSVIIIRDDFQVRPLLKFRGLDLMTLAGMVSREHEAWRADVIFVDEVGLGAGLVDRLSQLGLPVVGVNFGKAPQDASYYRNVGAEAWHKTGAWLDRVGAIPPDMELEQDLIGREYGFDQLNRLQLEKKDDMKKRGLASPDCADALAVTFALPVMPSFEDDFEEGAEGVSEYGGY